MCIHQTDIIGKILIHNYVDKKFKLQTIMLSQVVFLQYRPNTFDDGVRIDDRNLSAYHLGPDGVFVGMVPVFP